MSRLLINEPPLQVLPSLAVKIGLNEAIILQQIHYWSERSKVEIDGFLWVYNTVTQWREQFPFWSDDTIGRALKSLRERGVVVASRLSKDPFNKTLYYRIDYRNLRASEDADPHPSIAAICGDRSTQDASISIKRTENTAETTTERARKRAAPAAPLPEWVDADAWAGFEEMRIKAKKPMTVRAKALILAELQKLLAQGNAVTDVLDQSTRNGWQDVYAIKTQKAATSNQTQAQRESRASNLQARLAEQKA